MFRLVLLAALTLTLAPRQADAKSCLSTCGDICYVPELSAFHRVEVIETDGYTSRVRVVERLGAGDPSVGAAVGEELADIYSDELLAVGDQAFVTLSKNTAADDEYLWNSARRLRDGNVMCGDFDPEVPLDQYVAMAESDDCEAIAEDLEIDNECADSQSPGCMSAASGALGGPLMLLVLALLRRRRGS